MNARPNNRPGILIIGDSISIGYTPGVRDRLAGKATVCRPDMNCQHTGVGLQCIREWLGDRLWDVIHFNWGIWDSHLLDRDGNLVASHDIAGRAPETLHVRHTPRQYEANLRALVAIMRPAARRLIWASTTPVLIPGSGFHERILELNRLASAIMTEAGIATDDLYGYTLPNAANWLSGDGVHFTADGYQQLGEPVARSILAAAM